MVTIIRDICEIQMNKVSNLNCLLLLSEFSAISLLPNKKENTETTEQEKIPHPRKSRKPLPRERCNCCQALIIILTLFGQC